MKSSQAETAARAQQGHLAAAHIWELEAAVPAHTVQRFIRQGIRKLVVVPTAIMQKVHRGHSVVQQNVRSHSGRLASTQVLTRASKVQPEDVSCADIVERLHQRLGERVQRLQVDCTALPCALDLRWSRRHQLCILHPDYC